MCYLSEVTEHHLNLAYSINLTIITYCWGKKHIEVFSPACYFQTGVPTMFLQLYKFCLVIPDNSVQSVVSFDQGGEWVPLQKPANSKCDATAKDPDKVNKILKK